MSRRAVTKLAVFDIDGTLTQTNAVDDECFLKAVCEVLQVDCSTVDWTQAPHVTDTALVHWVSERLRGGPAAPDEFIRIRQAFRLNLLDELASKPHRFAAVPGAAAILPRLRAAGWEYCFATGGWEFSARLKLTVAGIMHDTVPIATSDDAPVRTEIVSAAVRRATAQHGMPFARVVSIGDGIWDVVTARTLGLPFVGVGESGAVSLKGANVVVRDFQDHYRILDALESASIPL